jgi:hypothetical protein
MPPPRVEVPEPEPELEPEPPPRVNPPLPLPVEAGGIVFGQGRSHVALQFLLLLMGLNAYAEAGSVAARTAAVRATPITFFMTFLLF